MTTAEFFTLCQDKHKTTDLQRMYRSTCVSWHSQSKLWHFVRAKDHCGHYLATNNWHTEIRENMPTSLTMLSMLSL